MLVGMRVGSLFTPPVTISNTPLATGTSSLATGPSVCSQYDAGAYVASSLVHNNYDAGTYCSVIYA